MAAFSAEASAVHDYFQAIPAEQFFLAPPTVWSPADNLVHLIKSISPVVLALGLPKTALRLRFGKAKAASRSLSAIRALYVEGALAEGGEASGDYLPQVSSTTSAERERILSGWQQQADALTRKIGKWSEANLEKYQLPHPLIGNLTVREILFFTLYHNMHHVNDVQRLLKQPESEWFAQE